MILTGFINAIYAVVYAITYPLRSLTDVVLPTGFSDAIHTIGGYLASVNTIIPIDVVLTLLALYVGIEVAYLAYKFIMWIIKRIPTQS